MGQAFRTFARRVLSKLLTPIRRVYGIVTRSVAKTIEASLEETLTRVVSRTVDARLDNVQNKTASLQASLGAALRRPMQECLDDVVRSTVGPLVSTAILNEMNNMNLRIDQLVRLNAPLVLPSLSEGSASYQSMIRVLLRRLKPKAPSQGEKVALHTPDRPSFVLISTKPQGMAVLSVVESEQCANMKGRPLSWTSLPSHLFAQATSDAGTPALNEALRYAEANNCEPILIVDIGGGEFAFIERIEPDTLAGFNQIVVVMYDMYNLHAPNFLQAVSKACDKIEDLFSCVHIHARNSAGLCSVQNVAIPNIIELTYATKRKFECVEANDIYPTAIDVPTTKDLPDIYLGNFSY